MARAAGMVPHASVAYRQIAMRVGGGRPERLSWLPAAVTLPALPTSAAPNICWYSATSSAVSLHGADDVSAVVAGGGAVCGVGAGAGAGAEAVAVLMPDGAGLALAADMSAGGTALGHSCPDLTMLMRCWRLRESEARRVSARGNW